jgi:hypothetical protein
MDIFYYNIFALPDDIKRFIYEEHFSVEMRFKKFKSIIEQDDCRSIMPQNLIEEIRRIILYDKELLKYLIDNEKYYFHIAYPDIFDHHNMNRYYTGLNNIYEKFTLHLLIVNYH